MKRSIVALAILGLSFAALGRAESVVSNGISYRVSVAQSSVILAPEAPFTSKAPATTLQMDEKLSRCDDFVAAALQSAGLVSEGGVGLVRDRVESRPDGQSWVLYSQYHQGYRILGAGGRLEIDTYGRVVFAGLSHESEELRTFHPMNGTALEQHA